MHKAFGDFFEEFNGKETISSQGGAVYKATDESVFERFLILGSFGTFYANQREVTKNAIDRLNAFISKEPRKALEMVKNVYGNNLAFRRDPAILALAALTMPSVPLDVRRDAARFAANNIVVGTDILHWASHRNAISGGKWSRLSRSVLKGYFERERDDLELQAVKYGQRDGWSMRDLLRLGHPDATVDRSRELQLRTIFDWIAHPKKRDELDLSEHRLFSGIQLLSAGIGGDYAAGIITNHKLPREAIPGELLNRADVWNALLDSMPHQALFRNLGKLSSLGIVDDREEEILRRVDRAAERLHPIQFLVTWNQYAKGRGDKGSLKWEPNERVVDALEAGYLKSFGTLETYPGYRPLVALDVSGSMTWKATGLNLNCIEVEICLIEVFRHQFPDAKFVAFSAGDSQSGWGYRAFTDISAGGTDLLELDVRGKSRLDIANAINRYGAAFMGTDLRIPLNMALRDTSIDAVITITDSETGGGNPAVIVRKIHASGRKDFKHAVVGLAMNDISVADPDDVRQLDFAGTSADLPRVIERFLVGDRGPGTRVVADTQQRWASGDRKSVETGPETPVKQIDALGPEGV